MTTFKDVYGTLNATSDEIGRVMAHLSEVDGSSEAMRLWARLEQLKTECEAASAFMLANRSKLEAL